MRVFGKSLVTMVWLSVMATLSSFVPPLALLGFGVLGIWLVIGRENFWLRIVLTAIYFLPSLQYRYEVPLIQLVVLIFSILMSYLMHIILRWFGKAPVRRTQFGLWQLGVWVLALSLMFTALRFIDIPFELKRTVDVIEMTIVLMVIACVTLNVVLVCCPFFVPKPKRTTRLWIIAFVSPLLILPFLEALTCGVIVAIEPAIPVSEAVEVVGFILIMHPIGFLFIMLLAWPMDADGYFQNDSSTKELA